MEYKFTITGIKNNVTDTIKYQWDLTFPPNYNNQLIYTHKDTICFHFRKPGLVSVYVKYKHIKDENWLYLSESIDIK